MQLFEVFFYALHKAAMPDSSSINFKRQKKLPT